MAPIEPHACERLQRREPWRTRAAPSRRALASACSGLLAAGLLVSTVAWTQTAPDRTLWRCRLCPFEQGTQAQYAAGTAYVSEDAARFADGNGYNEQGGYLLADGAGSHVDERQRILWRFDNLGLDSRALSLDGSRGGTLAYRVRYRELPHYLFDTTSTVFRQASNESLVLPAGWVRAPITSGMSALGSSLTAVDIASERSMLDLGIKLHPRERIQVYADYNRQEQTGTTITGASFFNTTSQLPKPIDQYTDELAVGLRYLTARGTLDVGYRGSFFDNRLHSLTWDNPFVSANGADRGAMAVSPDNSYQNLQLAGAFHFLQTTALSFSAGFGRGEQDEPFLPYTINTQLAAAALPRASLDGAVSTSHAALSLSTRPWSRLRVRADYRYDKRDNRAPIDMWNRVIDDSFNSTQTDSNTAYDFERERLNVIADADVTSRLRLSAGYDRTARDRNRQEVAGQTENDSWGRIRWRIAPGFELSARRGAAKRDIDRYDTALATELLQNPLLAKYNLAYRFRTYADVAFTASGSEKPFMLTLSTFYADDDYSKSRLGLTNDEDRRFAADFGWTFTPRLSLYAGLSSEKIDARQTGSEAFASADWTATNADRFRTLTGGVKLDGVPPRFDFTVDLSLADGSTAIDLASSANDGAFPELGSRMNALRFQAHYHRSQQLGVQLELRYERLDTEDWALAGVDPATVRELLSLGGDPFKYDVWLLGAAVTYHWSSGP